MLKICEKNSSVNLRFEIFVVAFRARKLFGTFEKRAPGHLNCGREETGETNNFGQRTCVHSNVARRNRNGGEMCKF